MVLLRQFSVGRKSTRSKPPAPAKIEEEDPWVEVKDESSGQIYYWNQDTDETTALGEPKPTHTSVAGTSGVPPPAPQQQGTGGGMMSGLGGVMAEGFAFGVGSSIARNVVGNLFGGDDGGDGGGGGDADGYDL